MAHCPRILEASLRKAGDISCHVETLLTPVMVRHQTDNILQYSAAATVKTKHRENLSHTKENWKEGEISPNTKENLRRGTNLQTKEI